MNKVKCNWTTYYSVTCKNLYKFQNWNLVLLQKVGGGAKRYPHPAAPSPSAYAYVQMHYVVGLERNMSASKLAGSGGSSLNVDIQPTPKLRQELQSAIF